MARCASKRLTATGDFDDDDNNRSTDVTDILTAAQKKTITEAVKMAVVIANDDGDGRGGHLDRIDIDDVLETVEAEIPKAPAVSDMAARIVRLEKEVADWGERATVAEAEVERRGAEAARSAQAMGVLMRRVADAEALVENLRGPLALLVGPDIVVTQEIIDAGRRAVRASLAPVPQGTETQVFARELDLYPSIEKADPHLMRNARRETVKLSTFPRLPPQVNETVRLVDELSLSLPDNATGVTRLEAGSVGVVKAIQPGTPAMLLVGFALADVVTPASFVEVVDADPARSDALAVMPDANDSGRTSALPFTSVHIADAVPFADNPPAPNRCETLEGFPVGTRVRFVGVRKYETATGKVVPATLAHYGVYVDVDGRTPDGTAHLFQPHQLRVLCSWPACPGDATCTLADGRRTCQRHSTGDDRPWANDDAGTLALAAMAAAPSTPPAPPTISVTVFASWILEIPATTDLDDVAAVREAASDALIAYLDDELPENAAAAGLDRVHVVDGEVPACTGITARWCPIHGTCTCADSENDMNDPACPLHRTDSLHGDDDDEVDEVDAVKCVCGRAGAPQSMAVRATPTGPVWICSACQVKPPPKPGKIRVWAKGDVESIVDVDDVNDEAACLDIFNGAALGCIDSGWNVVDDEDEAG